MKYFLVIIVLLGCSCKNSTVASIATMEKKNVEPEAPILPAAPTLIKSNPIAVEASKDVLPPRNLLGEQPKKLIATNNNLLKTEEKTTNNNNINTEEKSNPCAHIMCPMIHCENSLPPIPSQGICCQRCINNPKCNTSACPQFKCGTHLIPANTTAGECCDRCAPAATKAPISTKQPKTTVTKKTTATPKTTVTKKTTVTPKTTATPKTTVTKKTTAAPKTTIAKKTTAAKKTAVARKKLINKPKNSKSSSSSSSAESSSEENYERPIPCNLHARHAKPNKNSMDSKLIRLLTKTLVHLRRAQGNHRHLDSSESAGY